MNLADRENGETIDRETLESAMVDDPSIRGVITNRTTRVLIPSVDLDGHPIFVTFALEGLAEVLPKLVVQGETLGMVVHESQILSLAEMAISVAKAIDEMGIPGTLKPGAFSDSLQSGDVAGAWDRHAIKDRRTPAAAYRFNGYL